jgi:hypothetical protein
MTRIYDLAPEPLTEVIRFLYTLDWIALWLTGDKALQWKLSKGRAVRKMEIKWDVSSPGLWPSLIGRLDGLESFTFSSLIGAPVHLLTAQCISTLSRNLQYLSLDGDYAVGVLSELQKSKPNHFENLKGLHLRKCSDFRPLKFDIPRTVTDLSFTNADPPFRLFAGLPSLRTLDICIKDAFTPEEAQMIPRSVEEINLDKRLVGTEEWCIKMLKALPPNLRSLSGIWSDVITPTLAQCMPRTLESVMAARVMPEAIKYLPENVTDFRISSTGDLQSISAFPAKLRSLTVPKLPHSLVEKLPEQLTDLTIDDETTLNEEIARKLPRHLTSLASFALNPLADIEATFAALPPSLTMLLASVTTFITSRIIPRPTPAISSQHLSRNMKKLFLGCLDFSEGAMAEWVLGLPTCLEELHLVVNHLQKGSFASFGKLSSLQRLSISTLNTPEGGWAAHLDLGSLPRELLVLKLTDSSPGFNEADINNNCLIGAPPSIIEIALPKSLRLNKGCLVHLPNVKRFYFPVYGPPKWF